MRGQTQQLFVFLAAAIVIIASIWLGIKLVGSLQPAACGANDVNFQNDLKEMFSAAASYGSRGDHTIKSPCAAKSLCIVDQRMIGKPAFTGDNAIIRASVRANVQTNIFLVTDKGTIAADYDERLLLSLPEEDALLTELCVPVNRGKFTLHTEGLGRYIVIT